MLCNYLSWRLIWWVFHNVTYWYIFFQWSNQLFNWSMKFDDNIFFHWIQRNKSCKLNQHVIYSLMICLWLCQLLSSYFNVLIKSADIINFFQHLNFHVNFFLQRHDLMHKVFLLLLMFFLFTFNALIRICNRWHILKYFMIILIIIQLIMSTYIHETHLKNSSIFT